ncbi:MAG: AI-2E family transporter [Bacteroidetes bacterium]|nr:MAG: AI-2E family transporter [Bacteroidota bacterium]
MKVRFAFYVRLTVVMLGLVLIVTIMREAKSILVPILVSGLLAILISPFTSLLEKWRFPKALAVGISVISLLVLISALVYFFYNQVLRFSGDLSLLEARVGYYLGQLNIFLEKHLEGAVPISADSLQNAIFQYLYENAGNLTQGLIATASSITMVFIMPIYIFLFLYFRKFLAEFILMSFEEKDKAKVRNVLYKVKQVVKNYIAGMFVVIIILAILNSIALLSLGIKHAFLFAAFAALLNVIPFLGPFIGAILPITYAFLTKDSLWYTFGVFMAFYIIQLFESNLFTPRIVGGRVSMNPLMTIIALFVGNFIWGLAGMILFIPGIAILKVIFDEVEGMEAYGFLLGDIKSAEKKTSRRTLKEQITKVRGRFRL